MAIESGARPYVRVAGTGKPELIQPATPARPQTIPVSSAVAETLKKTNIGRRLLNQPDVEVVNTLKTKEDVPADVYIKQKQKEIQDSRQNINQALQNIMRYPPSQRTDILMATSQINRGQQGLNKFEKQLPYPQYTMLSVEKKGEQDIGASVKHFDYTQWAKKEYGSPGYVQPGVTHVPYEKELGYVNAIVQSAFDPEFWQEQLFNEHKGVDVINKRLYDSQNLENIGYNPRLKTIDPMKSFTYTLSQPVVSNVIIPAATGYGLGAGLGAVTKAVPAAGTIGKTSLTGVGAYYIGSTTIPPAITGLQTGKWKEFQRNVIGLGVQLPFMTVGFTEGYNVISKANIPTLTNRGVATLDKINTKVIIPAKTIMNKFHPRNLWVRAKATKVEPENIISKQVLVEHERFPMSHSVKNTMRLFKKGYDPKTGLYETVHARAYKMKEGTITTSPPERATDVYGLYVSSKGEASPYFLRQGSKVPNYNYTKMEISILPKKPSFRRMFVESITRAPGKIRYGIEKFKTWQLGTKPTSTATITPAHELGLKGEIEAVIPPGAGFKSTFHPKGFIQKIKGYGEYTTYMGRNIPIYDYRVSGFGGGSSKAASLFHKQALSDLGYYSGVKSIFSPSLVSLSYGVSSVFKPSRIPSSAIPSYTPVSYMPPSYRPKSSVVSSIIKSEMPSYAPKYTPPSYTPKSFTPSYTPPSYVPSHLPSYTPSYTPSKYYPPVVPFDMVTSKSKSKKPKKIIKDFGWVQDMPIPSLKDLFGGLKT